MIVNVFNSHLVISEDNGAANNGSTAISTASSAATNTATTSGPQVHLITTLI